MKKILIAGKWGGLGYYSQAVSLAGAYGYVSLSETDFSKWDALILPGGGDINPARFGQPNKGSIEINETEDDAQFAILDAFVKSKKPVLGICKGLQVINVYFGGTLIQDLLTAKLHTRVNNEDNVHQTRAASSSFIAELYGTELSVNSRHHQGIDALGNCLTAVQWSMADDVIEAIEHNSLPIYGVQFHPERMCYFKRKSDTADGSLIFKYFINQIDNPAR